MRFTVHNSSNPREQYIGARQRHSHGRHVSDDFRRVKARFGTLPEEVYVLHPPPHSCSPSRAFGPFVSPSQLVFATGVGMFLVYYGYYGIWSLFLPSVLSFACILYLIGLKIYLETIQTRDMSIDELREDGLGRALLSHDVDPESREG